jgi:2'-5' RNA ligase
VPDPLIVTLLVDSDAQERFDRLRAAHFPARPLTASRRGGARAPGEGVFRLAAHVTLFHALPGEQVGEVRQALATAASRRPFGVSVTGVRMLGRGVALDLEALELTTLRASLAAVFRPWLTDQDRQWSRPHVTVQNKVEPAVARALHAELAAAFQPESVTATGLGLWHYRGGPWEPGGEFPFSRASSL